jgi:putative peptide maturation system protein
VRSAFEQAVLDGVELLRELPRERAQADETRQRLDAFRREHPGVQVELVTDWSGGPTRVDYDLLIRDDARGTLALSHARDGGSPWSIEHAEHWAAQRVLTVDGQPLTMHDALRIWQARAALGPSLMDELLDDALVARALADDDAEVGADEAQRAADAIRRRLGLRERARTLGWLERHGLSPAGFEELARREARRQSWLDRMFAAEGRAYFEQHPDEFERVDVFLVHGAVSALEELAAEARSGGSLLAAVGERLRAGSASPLEGALERRFSRQLPDQLRSAAALEVVGPWQAGDRPWLAQVLARAASELDAEVRQSLRSALFERWLARARAAADVRWHWL